MISLYQNTGKESKKSQQYSNLKYLREETGYAKEQFPEAYANLEKCAKREGFEEVLIDPNHSTAYVARGLAEGVLFYPLNHLKRHEQLLKVDNDIAECGALTIIRHEKHHYDKQPSVVSDKFYKFIDVLDKDIEKRKRIERFAEQEGKTLADKLHEVKRGFYQWEELQTNVNSYVTSYKNKEQFIENHAKSRVYQAFVENGEESLDEEYLHPFGTRFIKTEVLKKVSEREKEIKNELKEKMNL